LFYISEKYDYLERLIEKRDRFYTMYQRMLKLKQDPKSGTLRVATDNDETEMRNIKNQGLLGGSMRKREASGKNCGV
jgi:hypothetical protein